VEREPKREYRGVHGQSLWWWWVRGAKPPEAESLLSIFVQKVAKS